MYQSLLAGTTTVRVSRKAAPKEMSLEATAEDREAGRDSAAVTYMLAVPVSNDNGKGVDGSYGK